VVFIYVANPVYSTLEEERIAELTTEAAGAPPADVGSGSVEFQAFMASKFKGGLAQAQALITGDQARVKRTQAKSVVAQRKRPPDLNDDSDDSELSSSDSSSNDSLDLNDESEDSEL